MLYEVITLTDWDLHLSTLFTEVRLRPQIELRSVDALPPAYALAPAALVKGLFYDPEATRQALQLFDGLDFATFSTIYQNSWRLGLATPTPTGRLQEYARELLMIACRGLRRQRISPSYNFV